MTLKHRAFNNAINAQFARIAKALASPRRLELLDALAQCPRTVESLANQTGMSVANTSQHLQILRAVALVEAEKDGLFVSYRVAGSEVPAFLVALRRLSTSLLGDVDRIVQQFVASRHPLEPLDRETLLTRVEQGEVILLDVRPFEEYSAGHIPGARSLPMAELERRLTELPTDRPIVAYCRGPYCLLAPEVVDMLRAKGFNALRLEDGVHEWRARGLRIAVADSPDIVYPTS
jgi:rhodanese-related sulfurtransferase/DNA-binding transcriptional ArsR family regulator